jgi:branched-chain amino acid transport system permease protein
MSSQQVVEAPAERPERPPARVQRWSRTSGLFLGGASALVVALAFVPLLLDADVVQHLTVLLILVILAVMWNALAGYGGLLSVGQQAFVGIGAYGTVFLAGQGVPPYVAMVLATVFAGAVSVPISLFALRLRAAQFAIGMWVIAEVCAILVTLDRSLGAGTGISLIQMNQYDPAFRNAYTYWMALGFAVLFAAGLFLLLRSPTGASLQAIRDDEEAAASLGVRVAAGKRLLFVLAGTGCGAAGVLIVANTLFIEPTSIFSVQWTAYMIFMVLVGGLGTFEGPILGAILLFTIQTVFVSGGPWYLVGLGATAGLFALLLPRGLWGTLEDRFGIRLMPVGYRVVSKPGEDRGG